MECMAGLSGRAGTGSEVDFSREIRLFPKFCLSDLPLSALSQVKSLNGLYLKCAQTTGTTRRASRLFQRRLILSQTSRGEPERI